MNKSIEPIIRADAVHKRYEDTSNKTTLSVLNDISFSVPASQRMVITGESGSGKTTLLSLISGLDTCSDGAIFIDGIKTSSLTERERATFRLKNLGFVFQYHYLLQDFSALGNVMLPLLMTGKTKPHARAAAREMLARVSLDNREFHKPARLSGGECQRVAIARALAHNPRVVLADEPTGALDSHNSDMVRELLCSLTETSGTTLVIATHDKDFLRIAQRHVVLRDGTLESDTSARAKKTTGIKNSRKPHV